LKPPVGANVASVKVGARVIGVSSNYGGEGTGGSFGATHAIDGDLYLFAICCYGFRMASSSGPSEGMHGGRKRT